jgi:hypothetical protein
MVMIKRNTKNTAKHYSMDRAQLLKMIAMPNSAARGARPFDSPLVLFRLLIA